MARMRGAAAAAAAAALLFAVLLSGASGAAAHRRAPRFGPLRRAPGPLAARDDLLSQARAQRAGAADSARC